MPVYLDHHAATPLCEAARDAMRAALDDVVGWANPSSPHAAGQRARAALERARRQVADAVGAAPAELVLTSGGTEACNAAVLGLLQRPPARVVTTVAEHPAMARAIDALQASAEVEVVRLPFGAEGDALQEVLARPAAGQGTTLVALQWVNHELGHVWPVASFAEVCARCDAPLVLDATQALGKLPVDVGALGASAVAFASHKLGGPAGVGGLWIRRGLDRTLAPRLLGGGQERGRRPGSPDVLAAIGFGAACAAVPARIAAQPAIAARRDRFEAAAVDLGGRANVGPGARVATTSHVAFPGWDAELLVAALDVEGVQAAAGPACSSGVAEPSPAVLALTGDTDRARSSVRFSFGPEVSDMDTGFAIETLKRVLARGPG